MAFARQVVEEHSVQDTIDNHSDEHPRFLDFWEALKWRLARQPEVGYPIPHSNPLLYLVHSAHWDVPGAVVIVALYGFSMDEVVVKAVKVIDVPRH